ncbi:MAG: polyprenyl synthetase family protein [Anaerolineae bacterium]|nr:MAG: polyprenyl synthetase family protein [Anaerolineae bacterium]
MQTFLMERVGLTQVVFLDLVQERIRRVEERMLEQANQHHLDLRAALRHLVDSGGKRIRPAVALLTGEMLSGDEERLITLSAAIEMLHTATLVHDDLIDGALLRRGIPTINAQWSPGATVLTGDFIFAAAAKLAAETDSVQVMRLFAETLAVMVNGEITQMFASHGVVDRENYYQRIYAKTASMFVLATGAAAYLSPVEDTVAQAVRKYGYQVGMAFQIVDDILDFVGSESAVGKPVGSDLRQGLVTLPAIYYAEAHPDDANMQQVVQGNFTGEHIDRLVQDIRSSNAISQAMQEARDFVQRGIQALAPLPKGQAQDALIALANYIVERDI